MTNEFREFYYSTGYALCNTVIMPDYRIDNQAILTQRNAIFGRFIDIYLREKSPITFLLTEKCGPTNIYDYAFDIVGEHSID